MQSNFGNGDESRKRVAAYIRVSTRAEEQLGSFKAQAEYYKQYISDHLSWELVDIYGDAGRTGTSINHCPEFERLINDANAGLIDLILVKSVSRFSRNTLDALTITRNLRKLGVEVYFEEQHLSSLDPKCEMLLSIMAGLAQDESRNLSENIKWGIKRKMEKGEFVLPYTRFLGYKKGKNGRPEIIKREARVVREIYQLFLGGMSINRIANYLKRMHRKSPAGGVWRYNTVLNLLTNEKYAGIALLQKTYIPDYLTHKTCRNSGELPKYLVRHSHPAIIDIETFKKTQIELNRRGYKVFEYSELLERL